VGKKEVFGGDGGVRFQLRPPPSLRRLARKKPIHPPLDGFIQVLDPGAAVCTRSGTIDDQMLPWIYPFPFRS